MEVKTVNFTEKAKRDYLLIREALETGSQSAYAKLMDYYRESLFYLMLKMCHNPHDAEDLTMEAFGKAFHNLERYTVDSAFSTWLFKIATNNCVDYLRKNKNNLLNLPICLENDEEESFEMPLVSDWINPQEKLEEKQKGVFLSKIVQTLKPKYRTMLELRYFKEYSYEEIAQEMGLPLGTIKTLLFRAKASLQKKMSLVQEVL